MAWDVTVMSPEDPTDLPTFTLAEVAELERPAEHRDAAGKIDYIYDGINFWCDREDELLLPAQLDDAAGWLAPPAGLSLPAVQRSARSSARQLVKP